MLGTAMILCHCSSKIYIPTSSQISYAYKTWPEADSAYLMNGYDLYRNKCGGCHYLYKPYSFSTEQWTDILPVMSDKAKLSKEEYNCIEKYIFTLSKFETKKDE